MDARLASISLVQTIVVLICITISWWALQSVRFDVFLRDAKGPQAKALQILLSVVIGYQAAQFLSVYFNWSQTFKWFF